MRTLATIAWLCALLLPAACVGSSALDSAPQITIPTAQIGQATAPLSTPIEASLPPETTQPPAPQLSQYLLDVKLDYPNRELAVAESINYLNTTGSTLESIPLIVEPARRAGVFSLLQISVEEQAPLEEYELEQGVLTLPLSTPLAPGERIEIHLTYELKLPKQARPFGYNEVQVNLSNWYAFVPPYRAGGGWVVHPAGGFGEHLVYDLADYRVTIEPYAPIDNLTIAAPSPAEQTGEQLIYQLHAARAFSWSASTAFEVLRGNVGEIPVQVYVFPQHVIAGGAALQAAVNALTRYQELFGPYPYASLSVVEIEYIDGLESDGLFFLGDWWFSTYYGGVENYLTLLTAHETAHNWWYGQVGNDQALDPWLDEALATYSELLYYEAHHPELVDWWWAFRVTSWLPAGEVDQSIYEFADYEAYRVAVYLRGAQFLQAIRERMGEQAFFAFLRDYAEEGKTGQTRPEDFFALLTAHSQVDMSDLRGKYFSSTK